MLYPHVTLDLYEKDTPKYHIVRDGMISYRAPAVDATKEYWMCIGTAMTFGRFVDKPFPAILNDTFPTFNFGFGHLESRILANSRPYRTLLQNTSLAIVQYSPLPIYLEGLKDVLNTVERSLVVVFCDIQTGDYSQFKDPVIVPGESMDGYYPTQETHALAASMILDRLRISIPSNCRPTRRN